MTAARLRLRTTLLFIHRWLGLTLGLIFTLVAFSGSLLLFQPQFFRWAHGVPDNLPQEPRHIDRWVENARVAVPELADIIMIWPPSRQPQRERCRDAGVCRSRTRRTR